MITLAPIDYAIVAVIFAALILRFTGDIRDVLAAKLVKNTMKAIVRRKFMPKLTVIIPFASIDNVKPTLEHLQQGDLPISVVVAVDNLVHAKDVGALRYVIRKQGMKCVKVAARKTPDLRAIAGEYARSGLVVVLPDTARLDDSLYENALVLFGDRTVDGVRLVASVRTNKTLQSGVEVLFMAWRRYLGLNGVQGKSVLDAEQLPEGVIMRAKFTRKLPKKPLSITPTRTALYSVAPREWSVLRQSTGAAEYIAVLVSTAIAILLAVSASGVAFAGGVFVALYALLVWWSLGTARISLVDRISLLLLAPFFIPLALGLIITQAIWRITCRIKLLGRVRATSAI